MAKKDKNKTQTEPQVVNEEVNAELAQLQERIAELEEQLNAEKEKNQELEDIKLRQMAEFDNYRRRTNKEKLDLIFNIFMLEQKVF